MKRTLALVVIAVAVTAATAAQEVPSDQNGVPEEKHWGIVPIPVLGYSPDLGALVGGAAVVYYGPDVGIPPGSRRGLRNNTATVQTFGTTNLSFAGSIVATNYFAEDRFRLDNSLAVSRSPQLYFGIGAHANDEEEFTGVALAAESSFGVQLLPDLFVGPLVEILFNSLSDVEDGGELAAGTTPGSEKDVTAGGVGARLLWDTTGGVFWPTTGVTGEAELRHYPPAVGSGDRFGRFGVDLRGYRSLFADHVLAVQGRLEGAWGEVPFQHLPALGGDMTMRGLYAGRYRDDYATSLQVEYRAPLTGRLGAVAFVSAGQVGTALRKIDVIDVRPAGGFGFRFALEPEQKLNLRIDIALSEGGIFPYIAIGEAF